MKEHMLQYITQYPPNHRFKEKFGSNSTFIHVCAETELGSECPTFDEDSEDFVDKPFFVNICLRFCEWSQHSRCKGVTFVFHCICFLPVWVFDLLGEVGVDGYYFYSQTQFAFMRQPRQI